jgi:hypothetical protein
MGGKGHTVTPLLLCKLDAGAREALQSTAHFEQLHTQQETHCLHKPTLRVTTYAL